MIDTNFWQGRRVLVTGHTGFKGAWLVLLLLKLGARVNGFALPPETFPSMYDLVGLDADTESTFGDVRDVSAVHSVVKQSAPEIILHLAAQALVRRSYLDPVETYATNVMGTVNVLEAARTVPGVGAVVAVTSDKCYARPDTDGGCRESDPLGGHDPYSSSKAAAEFVVSAYRDSYFSSGPLVATARAGNVIGGGDWQAERIVPDAIAALREGKPVALRYPDAIRPWQHVLDALCGYLVLGQKLGEGESSAARAWNFGPPLRHEVKVHELVQMLAREWSVKRAWKPAVGEHPVEATRLRLDASEALDHLGWRPVLSLEETIQMTARWFREVDTGTDARVIAEQQIDTFLARVSGAARS